MRVSGFSALLFAAFLPATLWGYASGPDAGYAGVPGESNCASCHSSGAGSGSVTVTFPGGMSWTPGIKQHLIVTVADPSAKRWGFELTARLSTSSTAQAGTFTPTDSFTQLVCSTASYTFQGYNGTCGNTTMYPLQYVEHTGTGTRPGTTGSVQFGFDWTPPATGTGSVSIYVAANAANGDGSTGGDHIYTKSYTLTANAAVPSNNPTILSANGVLNAAGFQSTFASGSWVAIQGTNLSATTRVWGAADFVNGALPTQLDNVKVTINNKPAYVEYVSPTLVNVQAPTDTATGLVPVQVTNSNGTSQTVMANLQRVSPAAFLWNGKYAATTRPDYSLVGPAGLFPGVTTVPAKPGDVVVFWATGLGATNPAVPAGQNTPTDQLYSTLNDVTVLIGNIQAKVAAAVLTPGNAGLYQVAVTVPTNAPSGDLQVVLQVAGVQSPSGVFLTVAQ